MSGKGTPTTVIGKVWAALCVLVVLLAALVAPRYAAPARPAPAPAPAAPAASAVKATAPGWTDDDEKAFQAAIAAAPHGGNVIEGRGGNWFFGDAFNGDISQAVGRRVYTSDEVAKVTTAVRELQASLTARGIPLAIAIAPAKWDVESADLPEWSDGMPKQHSFDELLAAGPDLPWVDLRPELRKAQATNRMYSPLNSHWTSLGGLVGFQALHRAVQERMGLSSLRWMPPVAEIRVEDKYNEMQGVAGIAGENPWTVPVFGADLPGYTLVDANGKETQQPGGTTIDMMQFPVRTKNPAAADTKHALLLLDSMSTSMSPYLATAFAETTMVRHFADEPAKAPDLTALVEAEKPDLVIYVVTERHLNLPFTPAPVR